MKRHRTRREPESSVVREDPTDYGAAPPRFIDLFCGIGGFRIAFERAGGRCVFSSDYDKFSQQTYEANFGERPHGDNDKQWPIQEGCVGTEILHTDTFIGRRPFLTCIARKARSGGVR